MAAYDFVGASSLADSYINEANPGTFNCAPGVAPTWAYGTGVTFNGTTQYLTTGVLPDVTARAWSVLIRFSNAAAAANAIILGRYESNSRFHILANSTVPASTFGHGNDSGLFTGAAVGAGVIGFAGTTAYINGASAGTIAGGNGAASSRAVFLGARNLNGVASNFQACNIQAVAIYSGALTAADVAAITSAMNALTAAGLLPSMMQHAAMGWR